MFNMFNKTSTDKDQRNIDRPLKKASRDLSRDHAELERQEKKLEAEIKKLAKEGNKPGCAILAKQLIQLRKQKTRTFAVGRKIDSISTQNKALHANAKLAGAMSVAGKSLAQMNQVLTPSQLSVTANALKEQTMKMDMADEMMNEAFDEILADSDEESKSDDIVAQVLEEIGLEMSGKMAGVPVNKDEIEVGENSRGRDKNAQEGKTSKIQL